ncbi:hypothetical protein Ancab_022902 [Ancistrocladus abbreviatus]
MDNEGEITPQLSGDLGRKIGGIAAGEAHTLALSGDGKVYSWGRGSFGRLGIGSQSDVFFPVPVNFNSTQKLKFVAVAAGAYHSLALAGICSESWRNDVNGY